IWGAMGLGGMMFFTLFNYRHLHSLAWPAFTVSVLLLAAVPVFGVTVSGAQRWISLGFANIQPSETAKISLLILGARLLAKGSRPLDFKQLFLVLLAGLLPAAFIFKQPYLGSSLPLLLLLGGMILFRGLKSSDLKTALV